MASYFDLSSPKGGAVFWSGNKTEAMNYANKINGTTMEGTRGGQVFDDWNWLGNQFPEWDSKNILDQKPIWESLSRRYANGASGTVYYVYPETYTGEDFKMRGKSTLGLFPQMSFETGLNRMENIKALEYVYPSGILTIKKSIVSLYYTSFMSIVSGILFICEIIKENKEDFTSEELNEINDFNKEILKKFRMRRTD